MGFPDQQKIMASPFKFYMVLRKYYRKLIIEFVICINQNNNI